jgi:Transposase DDE domain
MARAPVQPRDLQGLKYFDKIQPLIDRLHDDGCERDRAGNRKLHYDQYVMLILLAMFNPATRTLRALRQASTLDKVRKKLGVARTSLGALSEATAIFDPARLEGIVGALLAEVPRARSVVGDAVPHVLTAVDGSVVKTLATLADAAYLRDRNGDVHAGWRFHTHFEIDRGVPVRMDVTPASNSGPNDEKAQLKQRLEADRCYVMDRWYGEFVLFNRIVKAKSSYVCRIRDNSDLRDVVEERVLSDAAIAAGVIGDAVVNLGPSSKAEAKPDHPTRVVLVDTAPHAKSGGRKGHQAGPPSDGILRIATNLLDPPAEIIAEIYRQRWAIELFFRFFKHLLGGKHLMSHDPAGIQIQAYCAIIASLLITLWTGNRPNIRTCEMVVHYLTDWASLDELTAHLETVRASKKPA